MQLCLYVAQQKMDDIYKLHTQILEIRTLSLGAKITYSKFAGKLTVQGIEGEFILRCVAVALPTFFIIWHDLSYRA